jgi:hypothetical protein
MEPKRNGATPNDVFDVKIGVSIVSKPVNP